MRPPLFIDTSYFLALLNRRDKYHAAAHQAMQIVSPPFLTSDAVLLEVGDAFSHPKQRHLGIAALRQIQQDEQIEVAAVTSDIVARAIELYAGRRDKGWGLTDCTSFVLMQDAGATNVLTTDRHFEQAGFVRLIPSE